MVLRWIKENVLGDLDEERRKQQTRRAATKPKEQAPVQHSVRPVKHDLILAALSQDQIERAKEVNGQRKRITHALLCGPYGQIFGTEKQCLKYWSVWANIFQSLFGRAVRTDRHEISDYKTTFNLVHRLFDVDEERRRSYVSEQDYPACVDVDCPICEAHLDVCTDEKHDCSFEDESQGPIVVTVDLGLSEDDDEARKAERQAHAAENRTKAIDHAGRWVTQSPVIFDTETTGLDKTDEIIEIACVDIEGNVLLDTFVKPTCAISEGARAVHGIGDDELADAPSIGDLVPDLQRIFSDRLVLGWHFKFDSRLLRQSLRAAGLTWSKAWKDVRGPEEEHCIQFWYGRFSAGTSRRKVRLGKAVEDCEIRVTGPAHRAASDAQTARLVLLNMAGESSDGAPGGPDA